MKLNRNQMADVTRGRSGRHRIGTGYDFTVRKKEVNKSKVESRATTC